MFPELILKWGENGQYTKTTIQVDDTNFDKIQSEISKVHSDEDVCRRRKT